MSRPRPYGANQMMNRMKGVVMAAVAVGLLVGSAHAGILDKVGKDIKSAVSKNTCSVHLKLNNKCGNSVDVTYINFWHKSAKNKYDIPVMGFKTLGPDKDRTFSYDVLLPCTEAKKMQV